MFAQVHSIILQTQRHNISLMCKNQRGFIAEIQENENMCPHKHVYTMFTAALLYQSSNGGLNGKHSNVYQLMDGYIKCGLYPYTMVLFYHRKIYTITWMSLERGHVPSERRLFQKIVYMVPIRNTPIETGCSLVIRDRREGGGYREGLG